MSDEDTITHKGLTIRIKPDVDPPNPRTEFDCFGHMICFHRRYSLGDKHDLEHDDFTSWEDLRQHLVKSSGAVVILPLYLLDHSGITMRTSSFNDPWDSGLVGWYYATRAEILENYCAKRLTKALIAKATSLIEGEVKEYDMYLTGDVWGYIIEDEDGKRLDSCWGFFGREDCEAEAKSAAEAEARHIESEEAKARNFEALKAVSG